MIKPNTYEFFRQERVIFGKPMAEALMEELPHHEAQRIFVISTRTLSRKTDVLTGLRDVLGNRWAGLFDDVVSHVPRTTVMQATEAARAAKPDLIISIGGGSAVDTGKAVQMCLAEDIRNPLDLDRLAVRVDEAGKPIVPRIATPPVRQICIPTTLSGGEFSHTTGLTDTERHIKDVYIQGDLAAPAVILDPRITVHTPEWVWLASGMRAVDHAVGSLCSRNAHPFTDATTGMALGMLNRSLRAIRTDPGNLETRLESQVGVWMASTGMMRMQYGASHGLSWYLAAVADVPHGHCSSVLLPAVLRYTKSNNAAQQQKVSEILGRPDLDAADAVLDLIKALDLPYRLRDVGITREHVEFISGEAVNNLLVRNNPKPVDTPAQVREILDMAY